MRPAHLLALAGLLAAPPAAHSAPEEANTERTTTLQLLRPDEERHANMHVVLGCPDGKLRMLDTDSAGRVTVTGDLTGCAIHTLLDDKAHSARVPEGIGAHGKSSCDSVEPSVLGSP